MTTAARTALALLATVAVALGLLLVSPSARAADTRPCVSLKEFRALDLTGGVTRSDLEAKWEVETVGVSPGETTVNGSPAPSFDYKACGYSLDEVLISIILQPGASVRVRPGDLKVVAVARWRGLGVGVGNLHGRP